MRVEGLWVLVGVAVLAVACTRDRPAAANPAPAKVEGGVKESALTTLTLTADAEKRLGIETAAVESRSMPKTRTVGGEIVVPEGAAMQVTAPLAGTLNAGADGVPAPGSIVRKGHRLFRLIPLGPAERDASIDAQRDVDDAQARVEGAQKKAQRAEQLLKDGAGSQRAFEEARTELEVGQSTLEAAQARAAAARRSPVASGGMDITAPMTATLRTLTASAGQSVAASAPLFEVARIDSVWVRVPVYAGDLSSVDPSRPAYVVPLDATANSPGRTARRVTAPPSADAASAAVDLFFEVGNADGSLRPMQRVAVRLPIQGQASSLTVPASSLLHDASGGTWVYESRESHTFVRRRVDVQDVMDGLALLAKGPAPGTRVVTVGAAELFGTEFGIGK